MNDQRNLRYFLGGNTCCGFFSLYNSFVSLEDGDFLWIIKGGPGCGKSSFMKMIGGAAERAGLSVEYAVCSGDPMSLDGVYIPELKTAYMDGTAPHIADANFAAVDSAYIDLGAFYDHEAISEHKKQLSQLYEECRCAYEKAYSLFSAAGAIRKGWQEKFISSSEKDSALMRANGIAVREFGKKHRQKGRIKRRFLSALTCYGLYGFPETALSLCERFYIFDNRLHLGDYVLDFIANAAADTGHDVIICPNPLAPDVLEAVLVPSLSLGFASSDSALAQIDGVRHIRLDALPGRERFKKIRPELKKSEKLLSSLMNEGFSALSESKTAHDKIESIYNPNVDFDGVYALVSEHILKLGLK
ncbi:MAG: hypothetical protein GX488_04750 [Clostridiales bacterium]|nr:hypothetical protein [Clostridiales bacterium]